jgi:hypothetical protein
MLFLTSFYLCDVVEVNQDEDVPICLPAGKRLGLRNQTITFNTQHAVGHRSFILHEASIFDALSALTNLVQDIYKGGF